MILTLQKHKFLKADFMSERDILHLRGPLTYRATVDYTFTVESLTGIQLEV